MNESERSELDEARRILGWVFHRSNHGCFSFRRSERDKALSDVCHFTEKYRDYWTQPAPLSKNNLWFGEHP